MKIGLLVGVEDSFPRALARRLREIGGDEVEVHLVATGGVRSDQASPFDVILDRASHQIAYYRGLVRHAALLGAWVVNDPFRTPGDDRFLHATVAQALGLAVPRTVLLPQKAYPPEVGDAALGNLQYPLPWKEHLDYVGLPACLKAARPAGQRHIYRIDSQDELWYRYDRTGEHPMLLQELVIHERFARAIVLGGDRVILARYDPEYQEYQLDADYLEAPLEQRIVGDAVALATALGRDVAAIDFAIQGGVPYMVDALDPCPDFEVGRLTPHFFERVVDGVAELLLAHGRRGRRAVEEWAGQRVRGATGLTAWVRGPKPAATGTTARRARRKAKSDGRRSKASSAAPKGKPAVEPAAVSPRKPARRRASGGG